MIVTVLDKHRFDKLMEMKGIADENVETFSKNFFISINDTGGTDEVPYFKENHSNVLKLFFDDCDEDFEVIYFDKRPSEWCYAMSEKQAKEIIDFIKANEDKSYCVVHCAAGISRSGAVGTFINDYFKGDWIEFKKRNPYIHPNSHVLSTLRNVLNNGQGVQESDTTAA